MKYLFFFLWIITAACNNSSYTTETVKENLPVQNEEAEKELLMELIKKETECFFKRDYNCWQSYYAQTDYAFQAWNNENGTFEAMYGWQEVNNHAREYLKDNPVEKREDKMGEEHSVKQKVSSHPDVIRKNIKVKFFTDKLAYLIWDQYNSDNNIQKYYHSKDSRIMEKINGEWKIVNVTSYWDYRNPIPASNLK